MAKVLVILPLLGTYCSSKVQWELDITIKLSLYYGTWEHLLWCCFGYLVNFSYLLEANVYIKDWILKVSCPEENLK